MTAGPYFNLDDLNGDTFQQLCSAIVLDQFTPIATPYGAPGRDGGVDATHLGVRTDYSQIFDTPIKLESRDIYWVFQAKHSKKDRETDRQRAIIKALEKEIFDWLETRWDEKEIFPTCFILITNITINVSTRDKLNELGDIFEYFEVWDGAKVSAFVSANEAIRRTFFSNKDDRCDEMLNTLKSMGSIGVKKVGVVSSVSTKSTSSFDFTVAVEELIDYEILFTTQNNALAEILNYGDKNWQGNADWPLVKVIAKSKGIISLATLKKGLDQVVSQIKLKNIAVFSWSHFVGESIEKGSDIITFKVHPDYVKQAEKMVENIFVVSKGELVAHLQVDSYLLHLQKEILQSFDSRSYVVAERLLGEFYKARSSYLDKKKDHPTASYPNARSLGGRMIFGWDFLTVWETIYEDIVDIILQGKHTQQSISTVLYMPFSLCTTVISLNGPYQLFHRNFGLVKRLLFILERKDDTGLIKEYFTDYRSLCERASDTEYSVENLEEAENSFLIIREISRDVLQHLKWYLGKESKVGVEEIEGFVNMLSSASFERLSESNCVSIGSWEQSEKKKKEYYSKFSAIRDDFYFAWGTYLWHLNRSAGDFNFENVTQIIHNVTLKSVVRLYESNEKKDSGWFDSWFRPKVTGRMTVYSSSIDHDIRELLESVLLTRKFQWEELADFTMLESSASYKTFLSDIEEMHQKMSLVDQPLQKLEEVIMELEKAKADADRRFDNRIAGKNLSGKRVKKIFASFSESMSKDTLKGKLYTIEEGAKKEEIKLQAGIYTVSDKVWYVDDAGYTHYAYDTYGSMWAKSLLIGRVQVLVVHLRDLTDKTYTQVGADEFLKMLSKAKPSCLIISHRSLPWRISQKYITHKDIGEGRTNPFVGEVMLIYESRNLPPGEAILVTNGNLNWKVLKEVVQPQISLIASDSIEGQQIKESNQEVNLDLKVLIDARETGFVEIAERNEINFFSLTEIDNNE